MLIIEDGSIVASANSYVTLEEARARALTRGVTLSVDDTVLESQLLIAMDYLESFRNSYKGTKVSSTQALQWPRYNVKIDGFLIEATVIPNELKYAQIQLAIEQANGVELLPNSTEAFIKREKVGPIETHYSEKFGSVAIPFMSAVSALLDPLLRFEGTFIKTIRA